MTTKKRKAIVRQAGSQLRDRQIYTTSQRDLEALKLANQIAAVRTHSRLSQAGLAEKLGTKQAGVARMERTGYKGYTVGTLAKIAAATGASLEIRLVPPGTPSEVVRRPPTNRRPESKRTNT